MLHDAHILSFVCVQVSVIKAKISTEFGMPSGKQKLQIGVCNLTQYVCVCVFSDGCCHLLTNY